MTAQDLKNSILQQAIQGKLLPQNPADEPASELLKKISAERQKLIDEGKIKKPPQLPPISDDEKPFDIPESWQWVRLGEIGYFVSGYTPKNDELNTSGKVPYFKVSDMNSKGNEFWLSETNFYLKGDCIKKFYEKNTIVYPKNGGAIFTNKRRILKQDSVIDLNTGGYKIIGDTNLMYVFNYFLTIDFKFCYKGTALPTIDSKQLRERLFPLPPFAEQKRIVKKLEEILPLIEEYGELEQRLTKLDKEFPDKLKKSLLQQAIQGKLTRQLSTDGNADDLLEKIRAEKLKLIEEGKIKKEKPLPPIKAEEIPFDIPENWTWTFVGDTCINIQYGTSKKSESSGKIPVLRMGNIQDGRINYDNLVYTSDESDIARCNLEKNDLLFNRTNSRELVGKTAIYKAEFPAIYAGYLIRITPLKIDGDYLNFVMQSQYFWEYCRKVKYDAIGQSNINSQKLKNFSFPMPPLAEQKRIVERLDELLPLCNRLKGRFTEVQ